MNKAVLLFAVLSVAVFAFVPIQYGEDPSDIVYYGKRPAYDETQFKGKNILVTGGSSGIGYATALTFARFGSNVVIVSRDSHPDWYTGAQAVEKIQADDIVKQSGGTIRWVQTDVSEKDQIEALFDGFQKDGFMLDYAVNNAGIVGCANIGPNRLFNDTVQYLGGQYDAVKNNLLGTEFSLEAEIAQFKSTGKNGAIVNLASVNGYRACNGAPLYAASKFGIIGLTRSVGVEYARGTPTIRVNAIAPGFTNTSLVWQQVKILEGTGQTWEGKYITPDSEEWGRWVDHFKEMCPSGDLADPMDQANMIAYLLSDSAALCTGAVFTVDGTIGA